MKKTTNLKLDKKGRFIVDANEGIKSILIDFENNQVTTVLKPDSKLAEKHR